MIIHFDFDKSDILPSEMEKIKAAAATFRHHRGEYNMFVTGHTDNVGSLEYNYALAKRRNEAVLDALRQYNVELPIDMVEKAYLEPAADNTTDSGRSQNRRVVISFKKKIK